MTELEITALLARGEAAMSARDYRGAAEAFGTVGTMVPDDVAVALMTANAWRLANDALAARTLLQRVFAGAAVSLDVPTLFALGAALLDTGAPEEALDCFTPVAKAMPRDASALNALASAMRASGDPKGAWPVIQRALALAPSLPAAMLTAAHVRQALGDLAGAEQWLDRADAVRPHHGPTQLQRGMAKLLAGPSKVGWDGFEFRGLPAAKTSARAWHGESLVGASIAVIGEQGIGDQFHFVRYVARLTSRGAARVVVECHPAAVSLFAASGYDAVAKGEAPETDWYVPMLSLPHRLESDDDTASDLVPYLRATDPEGEEPVERAIRPASLRRVGLVLQGNPAFLATTLRDFDMSHLSGLLDMPNVEWVWLQYPSPVPVEHPRLTAPPLGGSWLDTARVVSSLDAVVSVDTSLAHLGGAMGVPTFVLLPYSPDWRWGLRRSTTPWYPTARLVRQAKPLDWGSVVNELGPLLRDL
jgi:Tfp pilus assembly protein PilF